MTDYRTPLARARGLGAAHTGVAHWWAQRLTAAALVPLTLWFVVGVVAHIHQPYAEVVKWLGQLHVAVPMMLFIAVSFWHAAQGMQVVIEDYVHCPVARTVSLVAVQFGCTVLALVGIASVLKIFVQF